MSVQALNGLSQHQLNIVSKQSLSILVLNLMPNKIATEKQYLSLFQELPQSVTLTFMYPESHKWHHGNQAELSQKYVCLRDIADRYFDGLIVTGAPLETIDFNEVDFWPEFQQIRAWSKTHTKAQLFTCWGAQAGLFKDFQVPKITLQQKIFGVFGNELLTSDLPLWFQMPQSRYSRVDRTDIDQVPELEILAENPTAGPFLLQDASRTSTYVLGHPEYSATTLSAEYYRDLAKGKAVAAPANVTLEHPQFAYAHWRCSSRFLFSRWFQSIKTLKEQDYYEQTRQLQI